jgi:uncharacterized protein HemY
VSTLSSSVSSIIDVRLKEQLMKSAFASTKNAKSTNQQYEQHIQTLEKVRAMNGRNIQPHRLFKEIEKAKHEYNDLQKTIQQLTTRNTHEKSKLER